MATLITFAGISIAVLATSFLSGILGMAGGMILMGVLLVLMPVSGAMMLHGVTQMAANGWRAWLWRSAVDWRVFRGNACGSLSALVIFAALQLAASRPAVYIILGVTPFIGYLLPRGLRLDVDRRGHSFVCGFVCTALQLLSGVSGPLLDVFFLQSKMDRRGVVATKAASQTFSHAVKILYFGVLFGSGEGRIEWWLAMSMVGLAVAGTTFSRAALERMTEVDFRRWSSWTVTAIGAFYLCNGILILMPA